MPFCRFRRSGIPYGPEVNEDEKDETIDDRGLVFICYQSSIVRGFKFIQQSNATLAVVSVTITG
jgi:deferrochelatase/peroxidase EfeB